MGLRGDDLMPTYSGMSYTPNNTAAVNDKGWITPAWLLYLQQLQAVQSITATLTNAEVLALPTTPIDIVPAPGPKFLLGLVRAWMIFPSGVAYTNVSPDGYANLNVNGNPLSAYTSSYLPGDSGLAITDFPDFFGAPGDVLYPFTAPYEEDRGAVNGWGTIANTRPLSPDVNQPLSLVVTNPLGDFTGGDPANKLQITTLFTKIPVPGT